MVDWKKKSDLFLYYVVVAVDFLYLFVTYENNNSLFQSCWKNIPNEKEKSNSEMAFGAAFCNGNPDIMCTVCRNTSVGC